MSTDYQPMTGRDFALTALLFVGVVVAAIALLLGLWFGGVWAHKSIKVWSARQDGKSQLAEAEFSKQVQLEEAKANLEAEKFNAQAEVERAKGAAESIRIEGGNLSEEYLRYLWIRSVGSDDADIIYVPTEGQVPIFEAGRSVPDGK